MWSQSLLPKNTESDWMCSILTFDPSRGHASEGIPVECEPATRRAFVHRNKFQEFVDMNKVSEEDRMEELDKGKGREAVKGERQREVRWKRSQGYSLCNPSRTPFFSPNIHPLLPLSFLQPNRTIGLLS